MKTDLAATFTAFLKHQKLENAKLLLMVSGGIDSVVLLDIASKIVDKKNLAVFHLNHNSRAASTADANFVQILCSNMSIKFYSDTLTTTPNQNTESTWRKQRQQASHKAAADFGATKILTAHHATDLVETMIFRLTKGCGPNGLSPFDTSTKPFWELSKEVLIEYAKIHQLEWREDDSNLNTKFERNLIRAEVVPALRKITPNVEAVFIKESKTFAEVSAFLESELQKQCGDFLSHQAIPLTDFLNLHAAMQTEFLREIAFKPTSQSEIEDALKWLHGRPEGHSKKEIGDTKLEIKKKQLTWQF